MKLTEFNEKLKIAMKMPPSASGKSEPYVSVNKLAEYMVANPTRRRQIIKTLKADKDYAKVWYSEVRNILSKYFGSSYDNKVLDTAIAKIEKKKGTTAWDDADNPNSVLALGCLKDAELPDLSDYTISTDVDKVESVTLAGVKVIIKPDIYLLNNYSNKVGGIKIHIAKTEGNRLNVVGMQYVATMIRYGFITVGYKEAEIDSNGCISIDVFEKNFGVAPKAYKRNLDALTAACEEIAARWPTL